MAGEQRGTEHRVLCVKRKNQQAYDRAGILQLDDVLPHVGVKEHIFWLGNTPFPIRMRSLRYKLFKTKGVVCVKCGIVGVHFAIERSNGQDGRYHINLYALYGQGNEILMTKDHIIPVSKGGPNTLDNLQTMCTNCNGRKADSYE